MSASTTPQTADQPALHVSNITAHPGSSWAGAGILMALAGFATQNPMPTTKAGWISYGLAASMAVLAALGK